jgi:hypothetical protein
VADRRKKAIVGLEHGLLDASATVSAPQGVLIDARANRFLTVI